MFPYSGKTLQETWKNILLYKDFKSDFESVRTVNFLYVIIFHDLTVIMN